MPGQSPPEDLYLGAYRTNSSLLQAGGKLGFWGCPRCCPLASPLPQSCPGCPPSACVRDTVLSCSCPDTPQGCQLCLCFHGLTLPGPQATCPGSNSSASASHGDLPRLSPAELCTFPLFYVLYRRDWPLSPQQPGQDTWAAPCSSPTSCIPEQGAATAH